jgi:HEAT repeat protein
VDSLLTLLKRGTQPWRVESVDALGKINDPRALEAVFAALKDKDEFVRGSASVGLAGTRAPERIKALIQALQSEDPVLQDAAALALEKISGKVYGKDTARWQKWWEDNKDSLSHKQ